MYEPLFSGEDYNVRFITMLYPFEDYYALDTTWEHSSHPLLHV